MIAARNLINYSLALRAKRQVAVLFLPFFELFKGVLLA